MKIFKCKAHPEYEIVAYSYETRHSWGHKATLIHNSFNTLNSYKIRYYNRTWETYQYQSVIQSVLNDYINYLINDYINDYKTQHSIKSLNSTLRNDLIQQAKTNPTIQKLETFYKEL